MGRSLNRLACGVIALAGLLAVTGCGGDDECVDWVGTWRGSFSGTVDGYGFDLQSSDFTLQITAGSDDEHARILDATWVLTNGYSVKFSAPATVIDCSDTHLTFIPVGNSFCFVQPPVGSSDNCEFTGSLSSNGLGSGSWGAPSAGDQSPTVTGQGTWSLHR
jgi:hypothetical protein